MATGFNYQFGKLKLPQSLVELFSPDNKHQLVAVGVAGTLPQTELTSCLTDPHINCCEDVVPNDEKCCNVDGL